MQSYRSTTLNADDDDSSRDTSLPSATKLLLEDEAVVTEPVTSVVKVSLPMRLIVTDLC